MIEHFVFEADRGVVADSPLDESGEPLGLDDGVHPAAAKHITVKIRPSYQRSFSKTTPDVIWCTGGEFVLVSERVKDIVGSLKHDPRIGFKECLLHHGNHRYLKTPTKYYLGWSSGDYRVADLERSQWKGVTEDGKPVVVQITEWVLDAAAVPELDIFKAYPNDWIVSSAFVRCCNERQIVGARFLTTEVQ
jgi:hypothetical protein